MLPIDPKRPEQRAVAAEVLALVRHNLRNKLATVRNAAFYLERRVEKTPLWGEPRVHAFFQLIAAELEAADAIVTDDKALGPLYQAERNAVDLLACLQRAREGVRASGEVLIENACDRTPMVMADADELTLALQCLLANAVEATPAQAPVKVRLLQSPGFWAVELVDAGPGLTEAALASAFTPFVSNKPGHTGLGLNIARRIIERWQGGLSLEALAGGGTRVTVTFPVDP